MQYCFIDIVLIVDGVLIVVYLVFVFCVYGICCVYVISDFDLFVIYWNQFVLFDYVCQVQYCGDIDVMFV